METGVVNEFGPVLTSTHWSLSCLAILGSVALVDFDLNLLGWRPDGLSVISATAILVYAAALFGIYRLPPISRTIGPLLAIQIGASLLVLQAYFELQPETVTAGIDGPEPREASPIWFRLAKAMADILAIAWTLMVRRARA